MMVSRETFCNNDVKEFMRAANSARKRPTSILTAVSPLMLKRVIWWSEEANSPKSKKGKKK